MLTRVGDTLLSVNNTTLKDMPLEKVQELIKNCPRGVVTVVALAAPKPDDNGENDTDDSTPLLEPNASSRSLQNSSNVLSGSTQPENVPLLSGATSEEALDCVGSVSPPPPSETEHVTPDSVRPDHVTSGTHHNSKVGVEAASNAMSAGNELKEQHIKTKTIRNLPSVHKVAQHRESPKDQNLTNVPVVLSPLDSKLKEDDPIVSSALVEAEATPDASDFGEFHVSAPVVSHAKMPAAAHTPSVTPKLELNMQKGSIPGPVHPMLSTGLLNDVLKPPALPTSPPPEFGNLNTSSNAPTSAKQDHVTESEPTSHSGISPPAFPAISPSFVVEQDIECVELDVVEQEIPVLPPCLFLDTANGLPASSKDVQTKTAEMAGTDFDGDTLSASVKPPSRFDSQLKTVSSITPSRELVKKAQLSDSPSRSFLTWEDVEEQVGVPIKPPTLFDDDLESLSSLPPAPPPPPSSSSSPSSSRSSATARDFKTGVPAKQAARSTRISAPPQSILESLSLGKGNTKARQQDDDADSLPPAPPPPKMNNLKTSGKSSRSRPPDIRSNSPDSSSVPEFSSSEGSRKSLVHSPKSSRSTKTKRMPAKFTKKATKAPQQRDSPLLFDGERNGEHSEKPPPRAGSPEDDMASLPPAPPPPSLSPRSSPVSFGTVDGSDFQNTLPDHLPRFVDGTEERVQVDDVVSLEHMDSVLAFPGLSPSNDSSPFQEQDTEQRSGRDADNIPVFVGGERTEEVNESDEDDLDDMDNLLQSLSSTRLPPCSVPVLFEGQVIEQRSDRDTPDSIPMFVGGDRTEEGNELDEDDLDDMDNLLQSLSSTRLPPCSDPVPPEIQNAGQSSGSPQEGREVCEEADDVLSPALPPAEELMSGAAPLEAELAFLDEMLALEESGLSDNDSADVSAVTSQLFPKECMDTSGRGQPSIPCSVSKEHKPEIPEPAANTALDMASDNSEEEEGKHFEVSERKTLGSGVMPPVVKDENGNTPNQELPLQISSTTEKTPSIVLIKPRRPAPPVPTTPKANSLAKSRVKSSSETSLDSLSTRSNVPRTSIGPTPSKPSFVSVFEGQGHAREQRARSLQPSALGQTHLEQLSSSTLSPPSSPSKRSRSWTAKLFGSRHKGRKNRNKSEERVREKRSRSQSPAKARFSLSKKNEPPQHASQPKSSEGSDASMLPPTHPGQKFKVFPSVSVNDHASRGPSCIQGQPAAGRRSSRSSPPPPHPNLRRQSRQSREGAELGKKGEEKQTESDSSASTNTSRECQDSQETQAAEVNEFMEREEKLTRLRRASQGVRVLPVGGDFPVKPPRKFSLGSVNTTKQRAASTETKTREGVVVRTNTAPDLLESASIKPQPSSKPVPGEKPARQIEKDQAEPRPVSTGKPPIPKKPEYLRTSSAPNDQYNHQGNFEPRIGKARSLEDAYAAREDQPIASDFEEESSLGQEGVPGSGPPSFKPPPPPIENQLPATVVQQLVAQLDGADMSKGRNEISSRPPGFKPPPPPADMQEEKPHRRNSEPDIVKESHPVLAAPEEVLSHKTKPLPPIPTNWQKKASHVQHLNSQPEVLHSLSQTTQPLVTESSEKSEELTSNVSQTSFPSGDQPSVLHSKPQALPPYVFGRPEHVKESDVSTFVNGPVPLVDEVIVQEFNQPVAEEPPVIEESMVAASMVSEPEMAELEECRYTDVSSQETSPVSLLKPQTSGSPGSKLSKSASFSSGDQWSRSPSPSPLHQEPVVTSNTLPLAPPFRRRRSSSLPSLNPDLLPSSESESPGQGYWNTGNLQELISARNQEPDVDEGVLTVQVSIVVPHWLGGTPIYKLYGYVAHFRVWFSSCFSLK